CPPPRHSRAPSPPAPTRSSRRRAPCSPNSSCTSRALGSSAPKRYRLVREGLGKPCLSRSDAHSAPKRYKLVREGLGKPCLSRSGAHTAAPKRCTSLGRPRTGDPPARNRRNAPLRPLVVEAEVGGGDEGPEGDALGLGHGGARSAAVDDSD